MKNSAIILPFRTSTSKSLLKTSQSYIEKLRANAKDDSTEGLIPDVIWVTTNSVGALLNPLKLEPIVGYLPFLKRREKDGSESEQYNDYFSLLAGILYTWGQNILPIADQIARETDRRKILQRLQQGFEIDTTENLILSAAAKVRDDFNHSQSMQILGNGLILQPNSSKIRSDLIMDSAVVLSSQQSNRELAELLVARMEDINLDQIDYSQKQLVLLSTLSAKMVLKESQFQLLSFSRKYQKEIDILELKQIWGKLLAEHHSSSNPFYWIPEVILSI